MSFSADPQGGPVFSIKMAMGSTTENPLHTHPNGQLIMTQYGSVTLQTDQGYWMVPPLCAVWVPVGIRHRARVDDQALIHFLYIEPGLDQLPGHCCTLQLSPLVRELIIHLSELKADYELGSQTHRLALVLLETLNQMPTRQLHVPVPEDRVLQTIAQHMLKQPDSRPTMADWAQELAMSERTLARHMLKHTGMSFGRWRQQFMIMLALQKLGSGMSVKSTARELGYTSISAFISVFKSIVGETPSRYVGQSPSS
ncbi:helix-turn-helix transcriptional regulator [Alcaligenes ammonioxydans]|uniref:AraC family transcriptional regulator n=1 Tax=Alcaligenes ammonioxydans TaxID=2582914 RepID=A0ABX8SVQ4_9BURK|nr:helix-turn-helix transcriptional regulator [Alcaligenes ammonioxydans]MCH1878182.1 helix-turn-helix transcriptional regulator [Alcaligenes ammonioxydans]QBH18276.1 AraC family transcriptional regulator [Alcaligenes faecalis]QXX79430.1 AraC family transcriptional regulator [Alcaligenes ammonioxydans]